MYILRCPVGFISKVVGMNIFKENIQDSCLGPIENYILKKSKSDYKLDHKCFFVSLCFQLSELVL